MPECDSNGSIDISLLSFSHKRVGCNPLTFSTAPEPKRSLLLFNNTVKEEELFLSPLKITDDFLLLFDINTNNQELMFCYETDRIFDNQNNNIIEPSIEEENAATTVSEDEIEFNNIANSSDYIRSLLNIINSSASEQFFNSPSIDEIQSNSDKNESVSGTLFSSMFCTGFNSNTPKIQENKNLLNNETVEININDSDKYSEEEGDFLLRNLPTSFDDFQTKEINLKLVRNYSTPRSSRFQSPVGMFTSDLISLPSTIKSKKTSQSSLNNNNSSFNSLNSSRTQSLTSSASHNNFEDLDDNDLEVAMINESFEEQQKQSLIYKQTDLKSLFYGVSLNTDNQKNKSNYLTNKLPDTIIEASHELEDIDNADEKNTSYSQISTPPLHLSENEFIPLLTPKSQQLMMQRRQQFCRSSKYEIPTSKLSKKNTEDLGIFFDNAETFFSLRHCSEHGYFSKEEDTTSTYSAPINNILDLDSRNELHNNNNQNFGELENLYNEKIKHRLDFRLKKMMLNNSESEDEEDSTVLSSKNKCFNNKKQNLAFVANYTFSKNNDNFLHLCQDSFLEEIAAKAISDDDNYYNSTTIFNKFNNNKKSKLVSRLPEVLMCLGPSTSKQNYFTIATAFTPDICHFYISPKTVENDKSSCKFKNFSTNDISKTVSCELFDLLNKIKENKNVNNVTSSNNTSVTLEFVNSVNESYNFNNENDITYVNIQKDNQESSFEILPSDLINLKNKDEKSVNFVDETKKIVGSNKNDLDEEFVLNKNKSLEKEVPIFDSWEDIDEDSATKMINQAKLTLNQIKNEKALASTNNQTQNSNCFKSLLHVIEASYVGKTRSDNEIVDAYRFLNVNDDVWHKKVDENHFLLIFPCSDKASQALIAKNNSFLKFKSLKEASFQCQESAELFKSQLIPKKKRGVTTVSVARRMIANSLNVKINVSKEQKKKEEEKIAKAKKQKHQKEKIWDN